jgi:hypothetical protein
VESIKEKFADRSFLSKQFQQNKSYNRRWQKEREYAKRIDHVSAGERSSREQEAKRYSDKRREKCGEPCNDQGKEDRKGRIDQFQLNSK